MRIFILEDSSERMRLVFEAANGKHDLTHAATVRDAIKKFRYPYDLILLDHDLADEHYDIGHFAHEGTGTEFAQWLATQPPTAAIIHSYNLNGAQRMEALLVGAGWPSVQRIPFGPTLLNILKGD